MKAGPIELFTSGSYALRFPHDEGGAAGADQTGLFIVNEEADDFLDLSHAWAPFNFPDAILRIRQKVDDFFDCSNGR